MPVNIHFSNETSAWRYLLPALFNFTESHFSWETCRFSEAYLDADKALLRDNQNIFSFVPLGRESFVARWLKFNGAPSSDINVYSWGCFEPSLKGIPFIQLPRLRDDQNGFLLNLKSLYPHRSLCSLTNERSLHPRNRIHLRKFLMPELTTALSKQLAAASRLQPLPLASDEVETTESEHCPHWSIAFTDNQYLSVLTHIDKYGCITEAEVIKVLGSARLARKFTNQIETYSGLLPFDVKVQSSPSGNRYTKSNS